jgi:hypothetical protein
MDEMTVDKMTIDKMRCCLLNTVPNAKNLFRGDQSFGTIGWRV